MLLTQPAAGGESRRTRFYMKIECIDYVRKELDHDKKRIKREHICYVISQGVS